MHKLITKFVVYLATSYCHNSAMIIDHRKFMPNGPSTGYLVSTFNFHRLNQFKVFHLSSTLRIDRKSTPKVFQLWKLRTTTIPTKIFSNVQYAILRIKNNSPPQCFCSLANDVLKKSYKLTITNTAHNAGIIQSLARNTRYHQMHELNSYT